MGTREVGGATTAIADLTRSTPRHGYAVARRRPSGYGLPRFRIVRTAERFVRAALRTEVTNALGHRMRLDATDRGELAIHGTYEPRATDRVRAEIGPRDAVLDIGADIGCCTLIFAGCVDPEERVFANGCLHHRSFGIGVWSFPENSRGVFAKSAG